MATENKKLYKRTINLLLKVKQLILEEPKRLNMYSWGEVFDPNSDLPARGTVGLRRDAYSAAPEIGDIEVPPCNTVGCIAGWTLCTAQPKRWKELQKQAATLTSAHARAGVRINDAGIVARAALKLTDEQADRLFYFRSHGMSNHWPEKFEKRYAKAKTARGRALATAARIDHFIATNGAE